MGAVFIAPTDDKSHDLSGWPSAPHWREGTAYCGTEAGHISGPLVMCLPLYTGYCAQCTKGLNSTPNSYTVLVDVGVWTTLSTYKELGVCNIHLLYYIRHMILVSSLGTVFRTSGMDTIFSQFLHTCPLIIAAI
ncbi:hypothetical protein GDO81_028907 [Engystomops pustulosus]|uniref:Uncharacterized protein n=1 Tax=Engystomops pustulosus TaxID=76066 RepID=A0AAV6ZDA2_ENGPU|nr:hypothetical protein GDO81_028907 [Engystomops pustulosus]